MLRRRSPSLALALMAVLWAPLSARAEAPSCGSISDSRSNVFIKLIMPPPCDDCEETKAELKELAQIQDARSPAEQDHAKADITISLARFLDERHLCGAERTVHARRVGDERPQRCRCAR